MSVNTSISRRRGWVSELLVIATGIVLLAFDVLPLLVWAALIACLDRSLVGPLAPSLVLGTFFAAVALTVVMAPKIHRWTHTRAARRQAKTGA